MTSPGEYLKNDDANQEDEKREGNEQLDDFTLSQTSTELLTTRQVSTISAEKQISTEIDSNLALESTTDLNVDSLSNADDLADLISAEALLSDDESLSDDAGGSFHSNGAGDRSWVKEYVWKRNRESQPAQTMHPNDIESHTKFIAACRKLCNLSHTSIGIEKTIGEVMQSRF